jgi:hypothetical protein
MDIEISGRKWRLLRPALATLGLASKGRDDRLALAGNSGQANPIPANAEEHFMDSGSNPHAEGQATGSGQNCNFT